MEVYTPHSTFLPWYSHILPCVCLSYLSSFVTIRDPRSFLLCVVLQHAFESDKTSRQERELQLAKRLGDLEYRTEGKFEAEKVRSLHITLLPA